MITYMTRHKLRLTFNLERREIDIRLVRGEIGLVRGDIGLVRREMRIVWGN